MKDFNGNELSLGDTVAFIGTGYRHMLKGKVVDFTKKMIRVEHYDWGYIDGIRKMIAYDTLREPGYVAKIVDRVAVEL